MWCVEAVECGGTPSKSAIVNIFVVVAEVVENVCERF
jgi:hypothetical protein